jgi:hypothetical protein
VTQGHVKFVCVADRSGSFQASSDEPGTELFDAKTIVAGVVEFDGVHGHHAKLVFFGIPSRPVFDSDVSISSYRANRFNDQPS